MSGSKVPIQLIFDNTFHYSGYLDRIYSPFTIDRILSMLPIESVLDVRGNRVVIPIPLRIGAPRKKRIFKKGDIAFWPTYSSIIIFLEEEDVEDMGYLGALTDAPDPSILRAGMSIIIKRPPSSPL